MAMNDAVLGSLKCGICLDYADGAMETECCQQVFCEKCLQSLENKRCPSCKNADFVAEVNLVVRRMIDNMPIKCPNQCRDKTTRGELKKHLQLCRLKVTECPVNGCAFSGIRTEFLEHLNREHQETLIESVVTACTTEKCPLPACRFEGVQSEIIKHVKKDHAISPKLSLEMTDRRVRLNNPAGRRVKMAKNGKFYCGMENSVYITTKANVLRKIKPCKSVSGNNCESCMKLDVKFRDLPEGHLVNGKGSVSVPEPCLHADKHTATFYHPYKIPVVCRSEKCGGKARYQCQVVQKIPAQDEYEDDIYTNCSFRCSCPDCDKLSSVVDKGLYLDTWPKTVLTLDEPSTS